MCSINCLFYLYAYLFFGDLSKLRLPLPVCIALWDFYYMHLFFQDMEDDFNRLVDFLIHFWVSFQNFINVLQMFFKQFAMEAINLIQWNHNMELNCKYIYMI